jgi:hypothetical protein
MALLWLHKSPASCCYVLLLQVADVPLLDVVVFMPIQHHILAQQQVLNDAAEPCRNQLSHHAACVARRGTQGS